MTTLQRVTIITIITIVTITTKTSFSFYYLLSFPFLLTPKRYPKTKHCLARGHPGVCEKNTPPENNARWNTGLAEHQIRGWRAVSSVELQGKGSPKRYMFFTDTGIMET